MPEKIGTEEVLKVKSTGRRLYLTLSKELCTAFGIRAGDMLKVKIVSKLTEEED